MMRILMAAVFAVLGTVAAAQNAEVVGNWKTQPDDNGNYGVVQISACGNAYCGTLIQSFNSAGQQVSSEHIGKQIVWDMQPVGGGEYRNGKIYAPDRDKTYNSRMTLTGNALAVSGCQLGICRSQTWTRN